MSSELTVLSVYAFVVMATMLIQVLVGIGQIGLLPLVGSRDNLPEPSGLTGRCKRTLENSVVAMVLFAPAILLLQAQSGFTAGTLLAAQIFLLARIAYVVLYLAAVPWLRSVVWGAGFAATAYLYVMTF
jgi:uncharacterized MAPEG superfamily protein